MQRKSAEAGAGLEAGEGELVGDDGGEADKRDLQGVTVEEGDAQQRQGEQDEIDGNAEEIEGLRRGLGWARPGGTIQEKKSAAKAAMPAVQRPATGLGQTCTADDV